MQRPYSHTLLISQIKEQFEAVKEAVKNAEVVTTTLNGLPGSWDSFIQRICARRKGLLSADSWKSTHKKKIKLSPSKEDPLSDEEYEELNS